MGALGKGRAGREGKQREGQQKIEEKGKEGRGDGREWELAGVGNTGRRRKTPG